ncbi:MAG: hypothetical protein ACT4OP_12895 [Actinomycetota bacterium]
MSPGFLLELAKAYQDQLLVEAENHRRATRRIESELAAGAVIRLARPRRITRYPKPEQNRRKRAS